MSNALQLLVLTNGQRQHNNHSLITVAISFLIMFALQNTNRFSLGKRLCKHLVTAFSLNLPSTGWTIRNKSRKHVRIV